MKRTKISDIAQLSNVSLTTVSRYFNHPELISKKTREKIEEAIRQTEYSRDLLATSMITGTSNLVGIVFPSFNNSFYIELLHQLIEQGKKYEYHFLVHLAQKTKEEEYEMIKNIVSYRPKGIVLLSHILPSEMVEKIPVPVISVEREGGNFKQINNDNFRGGQLAGELFLKNKCEVFVHINSGGSAEMPAYKRIIGYESTVKHKPYESFVRTSLEAPCSDEAKKEMQSIVSYLKETYSGKRLGLFCSNDDIAKLLLNTCIQNDIPVPKQWEIIGYDGSPISTSTALSITSIGQNISLMAQLIVESLENYIVCESIVPASLIEQETTTKRN